MSRAAYGQGVGEIALDEVRCSSDEKTLLDCPHNGIFSHDCTHSEDASVRCNSIERLRNISTNVTTTSNAVTIVSITWELQSIALDEPSIFRVECFNNIHRVAIFVNNRTYSTELTGFFTSTDYHCCISALYDGLFATRTICTSIYVPEPVTNTTVTVTSESLSESPETDAKGANDRSVSSISNSANTVGGVLGFVIIVLLILLALSGAALVYLLKHKNKVTTSPIRYIKPANITV